MQTYLDNTVEVAGRVKDLLSRLTLEEKIAQLGSLYADTLLENGRFSPALAAQSLRHGIGQISAPAMSSALPPHDLAVLSNDIQSYLAENTRLKIPAILHEECLNGLRARGATIFPQNIGLAAVWEPALAGRITRVVRRQMRATGMHQGLAPVLDVVRDPRWGRVEETFGEDPFLVAEMGLAYVRGLQGDDIRRGIVATLKHFAGHGLPEGGLNCAPAHIPPRLLREVYLYPFERAVKEGGVRSVMNAYHEIDGMPCAASSELLTGILRDEWGFSGVVVSDYFAIAQLMTIHRVAAGLEEAAGLALRAGIDLELPFTHAYGEPLLQAVSAGRLPEDLVDRAVERVITLKMQLGLFDNRFIDPESAARVFDVPEDRALALEAARKSLVLLKNDGELLPLPKDLATIAVIGPNADSQRNLLGDYTFPSHAAYTLKKDEQTGHEVITWKEEHNRSGHVTEPEVVSILSGIRAVLGPGTRVVYARGCDINDSSEVDFSEAVQAAREAAVAILVVGDKSGLMPDNTSGEMRDRDLLGLPGVQADLVRAVYQTGTPVVLVLTTGRPVVIPWMAEHIPAILAAWLPGEEGGRAVAEVLFGDFNPGGKLPVSFPPNEGQIPLYYGHKPSGRKSGLWTDYVDRPAEPFFEFGFGLSYTTFEYSDLRISPARVPPGGVCAIQCDIRNSGSRQGSEVVQLYLNDVVASLTRPVKELKAFERVYLLPGEKKTVTFNLPVDRLAFYDRAMRRQVEAGVFKVMIGSSSARIHLEGELEVTGQFPPGPRSE